MVSLKGMIDYLSTGIMTPSFTFSQSQEFGWDQSQSGLGDGLELWSDAFTHTHISQLWVKENKGSIYETYYVAG